MRVQILAATLCAALACTSSGGDEGSPAEPSSSPAEARDTPSDATPGVPTAEAASQPDSSAAESAAEPTAEPAAEPQADPRDASDDIAEATPPPSGSLRLVVLHAPPDLLGSQERQVLAMEEKLEAEGLEVTRETARADERSYAEAGDGGATLPAGWEGFETVVLLRLAEPTVNRQGKRFAQGIRDLLIVRPPSATPVFSERSSAEAGVRLQGKVQAQWILALLAGLQPQGEKR